MGNRLHQQTQNQGQTAYQDRKQDSFHEVSGGDCLLWQTRVPTALSLCNVSQVPPSSRTVFEHHCTDSTLVRFGSLTCREQLLTLAERPHLAVDVHLPIGEEVLNNFVVPLLGSQVQTRGALRVLDTTTEQALRGHPSQNFPHLHDTSNA